MGKAIELYIIDNHDTSDERDISLSFKYVSKSSQEQGHRYKYMITEIVFHQKNASFI